MKKLFCILFLICFMPYIAIADTDFTQAIESTKMPSDAQIMETLSKFNLNEEQKNVVFKDTKKKLQEMYSSKNNTDSANADLNMYLKLMEHEVFDEFAGSYVINNVRKDISNLPQTNKTNYSSIDLSTIEHDREADEAAQKKFRSIGK